MRLPAAALLVFSACSVPSLGDLDPKRCDVSHPCVTGFTCAASGFCEVSGANPCDGGRSPTDEVCDDVDNDCDGATDEGLFNLVPCELTAGVCANRRHACVRGAFEATCGAASYGADWEAFESRCDSKDNDCDGDTDEGGSMCTPVGVCTGFQSSCSGVCMAPGFEAIEASCDGRDNDCDGERDEGLVGPGACGLTAGVCTGKRPACAGDGGYEPSCTGASYGASYELAESRCDGLDNDCNGSVDRTADGGALPMGGLCELQAGVCALSQRACTGGGPETPCSALSYGPGFEPVELSCDALDNDCDGRPDRSREQVLAGGATTQTHLGLLPVSGGVALVYADDSNGTKKVLFKRVPWSGGGGATVDLSDAQATASTSPSLAAFGASEGLAAWLDTGPASQPRVVVARLDLMTGAPMWKTVVSTGRLVFGSPRVAAANGTHAVVVWIDAQTNTLRGAVVDAAGAVTVTPRVLSTPTLADGGFVEQLLSGDVVDFAPSGVAVGWSSLQGGDAFVRVRRYDTGLQLDGGGAVDLNQLSEVATDLRLSRHQGGVAAAWIGSSTNVRYLQSDGGVRLAGTAATTATDVDVAGNFVVWSEGLLGSRLRGVTVPGTPIFLLENDAGTALSPAVRVTFAGAAVIGYELDPGGGFDLRAQTLCLP